MKLNFGLISLGYIIGFSIAIALMCATPFFKEKLGLMKDEDNDDEDEEIESTEEGTSKFIRHLNNKQRENLYIVLRKLIDMKELSPKQLASLLEEYELNSYSSQIIDILFANNIFEYNKNTFKCDNIFIERGNKNSKLIKSIQNYV